MDNSKVQTLSDYIRYGKTSSFSIPNVSLVKNNEGIVYLDELVYAKYDDLIMANSTIINLTTEEYNRFRLDPQALSTVLYGTPNLDHLILYLNRCSEFDFDIKQVRLMKYSDVSSILKTILSHEENNIQKSINNSNNG